MLIREQVVFEYVQGNCKVTCFVTGNEWKQNTYIVSHLSSATSIVVDPGDGADSIIKCIQDGGGKVSHILLTHPHHDHVGAAEQVSEYFNVSCELHKQDVRLLMHAPMYALRFANKKVIPVTRFQHFEELCIRSEEVDVFSIHTPGHTKGSVCYVFDGFVMTGDTLLNRHVGRTDLPGSSAEEISNSINKLLQDLPNEMIIFPGHGKPWTIAEAKDWWRCTKSCPAKQDSFIQF